MREGVEAMRIIFETDGGKEVSNSAVTSLDKTVDTSSSANWRYAIACRQIYHGWSGYRTSNS